MKKGYFKKGYNYFMEVADKKGRYIYIPEGTKCVVRKELKRKLVLTIPEFDTKLTSGVYFRKEDGTNYSEKYNFAVVPKRLIKIIKEKIK